MSRCFPFPPPGYEKKARPDDTDLLKKEKPKEKKHKKDKRDKEKREGKEKREKDRSDGKHREKKDKKEKHKEKKKDKEKDRDKDKEKASTSGEKRVAGQSESCNEEKLYQKDERSKEKSSMSDDKRPAVQFHGQNGEKPSRNSLLAVETDDFKFVQELGRRIRDDEKGTGSQLVERVSGADRKKHEEIGRFAVKDTGMLAEGKEKNKDKRVDNRKMDGQGISNEGRLGGSPMVQNPVGLVQSSVPGMPRPVEKNVEKRMEAKEKSKEREGDDKRVDKYRDKDREKKSHGKDKDREKEKKKEEKAKEKSEHKKTEKDKLKDSNKNDFIGSHNIKTSHLFNDCNQNAATKGNLKKRKDLETNGFLRDNDVRPNKVPRLTSSHLSTENGRKLEPSQTPILFTSDRQGAASNLKVENKEHKVNGIIEAQPPVISLTKPSPVITHGDQIAKASRKLPHHPDTKYLSRVLTVPKMEEWSDFDDQEWLFGSKDPPSKKPELSSVGVNDELQVWSEALQIETADVCALPYVIPY